MCPCGIGFWTRVSHSSYPPTNYQRQARACWRKNALIESDVTPYLSKGPIGGCPTGVQRNKAGIWTEQRVIWDRQWGLQCTVQNMVSNSFEMRDSFIKNVRIVYEGCPRGRATRIQYMTCPYIPCTCPTFMHST